MEGLPRLTTQELIDKLYAQHDAEVHAIFSRLMGIEMEPEDKPRKPWGEDDD